MVILKLAVKKIKNFRMMKLKYLQRYMKLPQLYRTADFTQ